LPSKKERRRKMRNILVMVSIAAILVVAVGCGGGGKYADAKDALNAQVDMMEEFAVGVENAKDSAAVVAVMEKFQKTAEGAKEQMMAIAKKYPEMTDKANPTEELKAEAARMEAIGPKFVGAMVKISQDYGDDPAVQEAMQKMQKALQP
jgi:hypothetical protein